MNIVSKDGSLNPLFPVMCSNGHVATLDSMIRKHAGLYECKDCVGVRLERKYLRTENYENSIFAPNANKGVFNKLFGWCLG